MFIRKKKKVTMRDILSETEFYKEKLKKNNARKKHRSRIARDINKYGSTRKCFFFSRRPAPC